MSDDPAGDGAVATDEPFFFNPLDPQLAVDPFPIFARLREQDPVFHAEALNAYIVTGHDAAWEVLRRRDGDTRWDQFQRARHGDGVVDEPYFRILGENALMKEAGADHRRVRKTFQRSFQANKVEAIRANIQATADRLVDGFAADGRVELMRGFASPLPLDAISELLVVPHEREDEIYEWMHGFKLAVQMLPLDAAQMKRANDSLVALDEYFKALIADRRQNLGDDVMSLMIADADEGIITEEELVTNVWGLYVGGHDTTALSICNALATLIQHPDQLALLQSDLSLVPNAVEEILRHIGTVHGTHRLLQEPIELGGHTIPADTPIMIYLSAANHDESWCPHAESFDIEREVPQDHLAFGTGAHKCPGQHMGRAIISIAVETLLRRLHGLRIEELEWGKDALLFRGPEKLVLTWDSAD